MEGATMEKIKEFTYGSYIYMVLKFAGKKYIVENYAGRDCSWKLYKTSADNNPEKREILIKAFNKLY